jgi:AAA+ superfamily predicted ATPase
LIEANNPVDIGHKEIARHKKHVEDLLVNFMYNRQPCSLPDLILKSDPAEDYVMTTIERDTYFTLREGMQIFASLGEFLSEKTGIDKRLTSLAPSQVATDAVLIKLQDFAYNFSSYAASLYISRKLTDILKREGCAQTAETRDLSAVQLETAFPSETVMRRLLAPVYAGLVQQVESEEHSFFKHPLEFPIYVAGVFARYADLARQRKDTFADLQKNIDGYQFRIMESYCVLAGYNDISVPQVKASEQKVSYRPMQPKEIVGNRNAKRKIARYIDRLSLYALDQQCNPVLEFGGLCWSVLFDGPPGTGKSSLYRMAMTLLDERADALGVKRAFVSIDQSIKDEYYGKTGKILLERLAVTQDPGTVVLCIFDDIDLLTTSRNNAQGADNDINNIIMQYLDGVFTVRRGNVINFAASNKPTGLDDAMRNRFNDRCLIEGPTTAEDFADMVHLTAGALIKNKLLTIDNGAGYVPFATQDIRDPKGTWSGSADVSAYMADELSKHRNTALVDFGRFMADLKSKNPKITGRSANAIMEAVKERCANFDIPDEWFRNRSLFAEQPYGKKVQMVVSLYNRITPDILFQEAKRYFDSEERFARTEAESHVMSGYDNLVWNLQSEIKFYEEELARGSNSNLARYAELKTRAALIDEVKRETISAALRKAQEAT